MPALPEIPAAGQSLYTECPECVFRARLCHGSEESYCAYSVIMDHPRISLPPREDGRCPGFERAVPDQERKPGGDGP